MADINTKYTYVLEALRADGKRVMRFTNKPDNRAQVLINNGYKPVDETSKVEFIKLEMPMTKRAEIMTDRQDTGEGDGEGSDEYEEQQPEYDSDEGYQQEDEQQLKNERAAFERTGGKHTLLLNCGKYKSNSF